MTDDFLNSYKWSVLLLALLCPRVLADDNYSLDGGDEIIQSEIPEVLNENGSSTSRFIDGNSGPANFEQINDPKDSAKNASNTAKSDVSDSSMVSPTQNPSDAPHVTVPDALNSPEVIGDGSIAPLKNQALRQSNDFGGVPPVPGTRRNLAAGEAPEVYLVEEGDTMFDVCSQLIDDGNYWPKLWALNPNVKNPHFIYPGMKLAFYGGDTDNPPFIEVVSEDEIVPVERGELKEAELVTETVTAISEGGEGGSIKVIQSIDDPSPVSVVGPGDIANDGSSEDGVIFAGRVFATDDFEFVTPAFIFSDDIEGVGQIVSGLSGQRLIGDDKKVFITPEVELGAGTYSILRRTGNVASQETGDFVGVRYEFAGNVRIIRKTNSGLVEGLVFGSRLGIQSGDVVVNFMSTNRRVSGISARGPVATASSSVIGFSEAGQRTGGKGEIVFLEKTGLSVGAYYSIFGRNGDSDLRHLRDDTAADARSMIGVARVVDITGESAAAIIVEISSEVRLGDTLFTR
jgi:hypothetical protein